MTDLWKHRNKALHKRDNVVQQRDDDRLNNQIQHCMKQLLQSLRVFTAAEQRFFWRTNVTQLTKCEIRQKQQWINAVQSIIKRFKENLHSNPQARTMWRAMNLIQTEQTQTQHNQQENDNQGNQNIEDSKASNNEKNNILEHDVNDNDDNTVYDTTDESEDTDSNSTNSNKTQQNTELHNKFQTLILVSGGGV